MGWVLHARVESQNGAGNLTHELNFEDKPECNNEYGEDCGDVDEEHVNEDEDDSHHDHEDDNDDNSSVATVGDEPCLGIFRVTHI